MGLTANLAIPYPELTDTPDVPRDMEALADRVDAIVAALGLGVGEVRWYAGSDTPAGWAECNGQAVPRSTYAALYAKIGTAYGAGDGVSTFNLPDMRGRVPIGAGTGTGGGAAAASGAPAGGLALTPRARGHWSGEEAHTLTIAELAVHSHAVQDPGHTHQGALTSGAGGATGSGLVPPHNNSIAAAWAVETAATGVQIFNNGSGAAHHNVQPTMCLRAMIRAEAI